MKDIIRKFDDFIENSEIPVNSIEIDSNGRTISNKTPLLRFIDFLLPEIDYCDENKNTNVFLENPDKTKKKKNTENKDPYFQLSLKKRIKRIKNMKHYPIELNYYSKFGNSFK